MCAKAVFLWIVKVINRSLGKGEDSLPFIGVLDIFGEHICGVVVRLVILLF